MHQFCCLYVNLIVWDQWNFYSYSQRVRIWWRLVKYFNITINEFFCDFSLLLKLNNGWWSQTISIFPRLLYPLSISPRSLWCEEHLFIPSFQKYLKVPTMQGNMVYIIIFECINLVSVSQKILRLKLTVFKSNIIRCIKYQL